MTIGAQINAIVKAKCKGATISIPCEFRKIYKKVN